MNWVNIKEDLPKLEPADGFGEYYESELVIVAFKDKGKVFYEVAKFTKGRDTTDGEFWELWYAPQAEDIVNNVIAWFPFPFYS